MNQQIGFDNESYLAEQTAAIMDRLKELDCKLYLEFGGKLLNDFHAARVLPGFDPNVKMRLLQQMKEQVDVVLCIYAGDIEKKKVRADFGITYDADALKLIDDLETWGISLNSVVITRYQEQAAATIFRNKLERRGLKVFTHRYTRGYPTDLDTVVSEEGYGANDYLESEKPIIVITGPGPGSGKLATCLSQLYHDHKRGVASGYAKFETFPIWNLPLKHEVNLAYEAATAELKDVNMIDHFHLENYGETAVNYNRDIEAFPILTRIMEKIAGEPPRYKSPTDMGVNRAGFGITNDSLVRAAAREEILRRYYRYSCEYAMGFVDKDAVEKIQLLMDELNLVPHQRKVVQPARAAALQARKRGKGHDGIYCGAAIELPDGSIVTGQNSPLLHAASSLIIHAGKQLAGIPENIDLLPMNIIESVGRLKREVFQGEAVSLNLSETLIALSISAIGNPSADAVMQKLAELRNCDAHMTHMPTPGDEAGMRKLGVNLTSDPDFASKRLFIS